MELAQRILRRLSGRDVLWESLAFAEVRLYRRTVGGRGRLMAVCEGIAVFAK